MVEGDGEDDDWPLSDVLSDSSKTFGGLQSNLQSGHFDDFSVNHGSKKK